MSLYRPSGPNKALKLGSRGKEVDDFVDKLKSEGENIIMPVTGKKQSDASKALPPPVNTERYHRYFVISPDPFFRDKMYTLLSIPHIPESLVWKNCIIEN